MKSIKTLLLTLLIITTCSFYSDIHAQEIASVELGESISVQVYVCGVFKSDRSLWVYEPGNPDNVREFIISEEARNFEQIEVGDLINIEYYESVALALNAPGELPEEDDGLVVVRAAEGEKPAGVAVHVYDISAIVQAYDEDAGIATLVGPRGNVLDVLVSDLAYESGIIEIGQTVHVRYTQTLAISVEKVD